MAEKFFYFAYGSNLYSKRIHINNPTAVRIGPGKLDGYRIDFGHYAPSWKGCAATITEQKGSHVWGAVWQIDNTNLESLDKQEGVDKGVYKRLNLDIQLENQAIKCLSYQEASPVPFTPVLAELPTDRRPSKIYLGVIKKGAVESQLPKEYINFLFGIPDNGYNGETEIKILE